MSIFKLVIPVEAENVEDAEAKLFEALDTNAVELSVSHNPVVASPGPMWMTGLLPMPIDQLVMSYAHDGRGASIWDGEHQGYRFRQDPGSD